VSPLGFLHSDRLLRWLWIPIGTLGGLGYAPVAPGSVGSLAVMGAVWVWGPMASAALMVWAIALFLVGTAAAWILEARWGKDPGRIVIDEAAGMLIGLIWVPPDLWWLGTAWLLFRVFDIWKPFPCRQLERVPHGWGVTLDDIMAGIYTCGVVHGLLWLAAVLP